MCACVPSFSSFMFLLLTAFGPGRSLFRLLPLMQSNPGDVAPHHLGIGLECAVADFLCCTADSPLKLGIVKCFAPAIELLVIRHRHAWDSDSPELCELLDSSDDGHVSFLPASPSLHPHFTLGVALCDDFGQRFEAHLMPVDALNAFSFCAQALSGSRSCIPIWALKTVDPKVGGGRHRSPTRELVDGE